MNSDIIKSWKNEGVHNFSLGCLCTYFSLNENLQRGKATILERSKALYLEKPKPKTFVFAEEVNDKDIEKLLLMNKAGPVYSIYKIPDLGTPTDFQEVVYNLDTVFDPASYPNTDKRKKALRAPFKKLDDWKVTAEQITKKNFDEAEMLHTEWCEAKLADEKTYKILFSTNRYIRCIEVALMNQKKGPFGAAFEIAPKYVPMLYRIDGRPSAVFMSSVEGNSAYSLVGFSAFWETPSQFTHHVNIHFMRYLHENGVKFVNDGASLNKNLKAYKTHWPYTIKLSYRYARRKG